jgi:hypothetical protein
VSANRASVNLRNTRTSGVQLIHQQRQNCKTEETSPMSLIHAAFRLIAQHLNDVVEYKSIMLNVQTVAPWKQQRPARVLLADLSACSRWVGPGLPRLRASAFGRPGCASDGIMTVWRRGRGSNSRLEVVWTSPFPLGYRASCSLNQLGQPEAHRSRTAPKRGIVRCGKPHIVSHLFLGMSINMLDYIGDSEEESSGKHRFVG